jgi:hypothetical protein
MTNPYYTENFGGYAGQTARAEEVSSEFSGVQSGFDGVSADISRSIRGNTGETLQNLPAALTRANQWLRFDSNGQPITVTAPFNWSGLWQPNHLYYVGDVMQIGVHQSLMYCTTQHTSGATYSGNNWITFIDLSGVAFFNYRIINTAGTSALAKGDSVGVDATGGNIILNLPPDAVLGDSPINITHVGGSLANGQAVDVYSTGALTINGTVETHVSLNKVGASFSFSYLGPAYGWRLRVMG